MPTASPGRSGSSGGSSAGGHAVARELRPRLLCGRRRARRRHPARALAFARPSQRLARRPGRELGRDRGSGRQPRRRASCEDALWRRLEASARGPGPPRASAFASGIVSNFYGNLEASASTRASRATFAVVVDSAVVGCRRSRTRASSRRRSTRSACSAEAAVFVGDSLPRDMGGARGLGMPHVWRRDRTAPPACCPDDRVIAQPGGASGDAHSVSAITAGRRHRGGRGSRLKGLGVPKPMVEVAGVPLIEHVLENLRAAGVASAAVIFNAAEEGCAAYVRERFARRWSPKVVVKNTRVLARELPRDPERGARGPAARLDGRRVLPAPGFRALRARPPRRRLRTRPSSRSRASSTTRSPLWVTTTRKGRVTVVGGASGDAVTAGIYVIPGARPRGCASPTPCSLPRLRDFLAWLCKSGEPMQALEVGKVVDVDRAEDLEIAEELARSLPEARRERRALLGRLPRARAFAGPRDRRRARSCARPRDELERARLRRGAQVARRAARRHPGGRRRRAAARICSSCASAPRSSSGSRPGSGAGRAIVNRPAGIRNTDRERTIALFAQRRRPVPRTASSCDDREAARRRFRGPCWVKRGDVHATQEGDVAFADGRRRAGAAARALARRGIARAVVQDHAPGDLIKFYGVSATRRRTIRQPPARPSWFQWFYHRDQDLRRYPFDAEALGAAAARAAAALGLDVYGGDAIVSPDGRDPRHRPERVAELRALPRGRRGAHRRAAWPRASPGTGVRAAVSGDGRSGAARSAPRSKEIVELEQRHMAPGLQSFALYSGLAMARGPRQPHLRRGRQLLHRLHRRHRGRQRRPLPSALRRRRCSVRRRG